MKNGLLKDRIHPVAPREWVLFGYGLGVFLIVAALALIIWASVSLAVAISDLILPVSPIFFIGFLSIAVGSLVEKKRKRALSDQDEFLSSLANKSNG